MPTSRLRTRSSSILTSTENNGQPAADREFYHCSSFEVDGKAVRFRDYDSESGKVYDWFRVVKDDDGKVVVRENSVVRPRASGDAN